MSIYQVWVVDCDECGDVCSYGEDESTIPDKCENCGAEVADAPSS